MTRQNTLITCILTLAVLLSVLCFVLAFFFSCCCNLPQNGQSWLFPGWDQYQWFLEMLSHLIRDHKAEVSELGVNPKMIGTHSIRKGAVTYMSSLPGGPSISSVCIHAGWTMGTVKDVYMWYLSLGDQFVGCCLVMLPLDNNPDCVVVTFPWSSNGGSFMGVPPHVAVLQELHSLKVKQQSLIDNFISKVKTAIEECDLAGGTL